jgi:hypothetical protein
MVEGPDDPQSIAELGPQASAELAIRAEQTWAEAGERLRGVNATEKFIELKERELQKWVYGQIVHVVCYVPQPFNIACDAWMHYCRCSVIAQNYARIQGVEKELQGLQLQVQGVLHVFTEMMYQY